MSDFLMVVPEGWAEVSTSWIGESNDISELNHMLNNEQWLDVENIMALTGQLPEGHHVLAARLVTLNDGHHLWILFG